MIRLTRFVLAAFTHTVRQLLELIFEQRMSV